MRLIVTSELTKPVSLEGGSGVNKIVHYLTEGLVKNGHEVILLASGDSKTSAQLIPVIPEHLDSIPNLHKKVKDLSKVKAITYLPDLIKNEDDIIVNHLVWRLLLFTDKITNPIVTTQHNDPLSDYANAIYKLPFKNRFHICLSENQSKIASEKGIAVSKTIYNGVPVNDFVFRETASEDYFFYLGRISKGKGLDEIISAAEKFGKQLFVAGGKDEMEVEYYEKTTEKLKQSEKTEYLGEIDFAKKSELLSNTKFFLFPDQWEEPFGLVVAESMATGTPVIAYSRGSLPELIKDGETGFLVNESDQLIRGEFIVKKTGFDGLCEAIERMYSLPEEQYRQMRKAARKRVEENFTIDKMVDEYEAFFQTILENRHS